MESESSIVRIQRELFEERVVDAFGQREVTEPQTTTVEELRIMLEAHEQRVQELEVSDAALDATAAEIRREVDADIINTLVQRAVENDQLEPWFPPAGTIRSPIEMFHNEDINPIVMGEDTTIWGQQSTVDHEPMTEEEAYRHRLGL